MIHRRAAWISAASLLRGAENLEKVFLFFATVSQRTHKGFIIPGKP
jgi:hypothetical protein